MNILHATDFHARKNTGITFAINGLIEQGRSFLPSPSKLALVSVGQGDVEPPPDTVTTNVRLSGLPFAMAWAYAPKYSAVCKGLIRHHDISVVHVHGAWLHPQYAAVRAASSLGVPVVLTNHGLFEHWALREHKQFKKSLYLAMMRNRIFQKVQIFHAITPANKVMLNELFPTSEIALITNAINLNDVDINSERRVQTECSPYILFFGRLSPEKGIDLLIKAFEHASLPSDVQLLIAGPEDAPHYAQYIYRMVALSPRRARIKLIGPVWDHDQKYNLMRNAQLVAVPSRSEVVGLVNLEASACYTPTITTPTTGLDDWEQGGGLLVVPTIENIARAIERGCVWSDTERAERGRASRRLIERRYSTHVTGPLWAELYRLLTCYA